MNNYMINDKIELSAMNNFTIKDSIDQYGTLNSYGNRIHNISDDIDYLMNKNRMLSDEIKQLKKIISRLSTLVCTHIGEEQAENFK